MQITADISEISKTVQGDVNFISSVLSESSINFAYLSIVLAKRNVFSFTWSDFYRKRGCITMHNYAGTCKDICSSNLDYNFLI